ncbi:MAG: class F sortase [Patescibacteria group bacterium]|nr:class F sortase [Patescibacteria group bacterium]
MQSQTPIKWPPTVGDIVGIAFSLIVVFLLIHGLSAEDSFTSRDSSAESEIRRDIASVASVEFVHTRSELPTRLIIPKINVNATLEYVGLTAEGEMDVPEDPSNAAWLYVGFRPGEVGTAVIDGHYGWKDGIPAIFDNLHTLQKGDELYVEDEKGDITMFIVRESRRYDPDADASDVFGSDDGKSHLNLITCEGDWNADQKNYSNRLVVFTDKY